MFGMARLGPQKVHRFWAKTPIDMALVSHVYGGGSLHRRCPDPACSRSGMLHMMYVAQHYLWSKNRKRHRTVILKRKRPSLPTCQIWRPYSGLHSCLSVHGRVEANVSLIPSLLTDFPAEKKSSFCPFAHSPCNHGECFTHSLHAHEYIHSDQASRGRLRLIARLTSARS